MDMKINLCRNEILCNFNEHIDFTKYDFALNSVHKLAQLNINISIICKLIRKKSMQNVAK